MEQKIVLGGDNLVWLAEQAQFKVIELYEAVCEVEDLNPGGDLHEEFVRANQVVDYLIMCGVPLEINEDGEIEGRVIVESSYRNSRNIWKALSGLW